MTEVGFFGIARPVTSSCLHIYLLKYQLGWIPYWVAVVGRLDVNDPHIQWYLGSWDKS